MLAELLNGVFPVILYGNLNNQPGINGLLVRPRLLVDDLKSAIVSNGEDVPGLGQAAEMAAIKVPFRPMAARILKIEGVLQVIFINQAVGNLSAIILDIDENNLKWMLPEPNQSLLCDVQKTLYCSRKILCKQAPPFAMESLRSFLLSSSWPRY